MWDGLLALLVRRFRAWAGNDRGSVAVYFGFAMFPLMAAAGGAVDLERQALARAQLQTAMDGAVLSGVSRTGAVASAFFLAASSQSGATLQGAPSFVFNADGSLTGTAVARLPTSTMNILGFLSMPISVTATASLYGASGGDKVCILILDPSASQPLLVNSGVALNAPACEIDVATSGSPAAIFNSGVALNVAKICVQGSSVIQNGGAVPSLSTGCPTASDPFKGNLPAVASSNCSVNGQNFSGAVTLSPGTYCGNYNFNGAGTLTLQPGLYVFRNTSWNVNSGWTINGAGVTIYFADSASHIQINSGAALNVAAPTSGLYSNILLYEASGLSSSSFTIDGGAGHSFSGLIYLPSRNVTFNAMATVSSESLTMVFNQLILDTDNWAIAPGALAIPSAGSHPGKYVHLVR